MTRTCISVLGIVVMLMWPQQIFAATVSTSANTSSITETTEVDISVTLSIQTADSTEYYLRGVFFKSGSSQYCGYTKGTDGFYNGPYTSNDGYTKLPKATISDNSWSGTIQVKIDPQDPHCSDSGEYKFKVQRYNQSGTGSFDDQSELSFTVTLPTPTPTATSTPSPTATPTKTPSPTRTPTPTKTPTPTDTDDNEKTPTPTSSDVVAPTQMPEDESGATQEAFTAMNADTQALGVSDSSLADNANLPSVQVQSATDKPYLSIWLFMAVLFLITPCGIMLYRKVKYSNE